MTGQRNPCRAERWSSLGCGAAFTAARSGHSQPHKGPNTEKLSHRLAKAAAMRSEMANAKGEGPLSEQDKGDVSGQSRNEKGRDMDAEAETRGAVRKGSIGHESSLDEEASGDRNSNKVTWVS